jgi:hypothetical protein
VDIVAVCPSGGSSVPICLEVGTLRPQQQQQQQEDEGAGDATADGADGGGGRMNQGGGGSGSGSGSGGGKCGGRLVVRHIPFPFSARPSLSPTARSSCCQSKNKVGRRNSGSGSGGSGEVDVYWASTHLRTRLLRDIIYLSTTTSTSSPSFAQMTTPSLGPLPTPTSPAVAGPLSSDPCEGGDANEGLLLMCPFQKHSDKKQQQQHRSDATSSINHSETQSECQQTGGPIRGSPQVHTVPSAACLLLQVSHYFLHGLLCACLPAYLHCIRNFCPPFLHCHHRNPAVAEAVLCISHC